MSTSTHQEVAPKTPKPHINESYDSNPFTLSFNALGRFFNTNAGWAIALIVLGFFGFILQIASDAFRYLTNGDSTQNNLGSSTASVGGSAIDPTVVLAIVVVVFVIMIFAVTIGTLISTFINGVFSYVALQSEAGRKVAVGDAFNATMKRFWRLFLAQILANLKIFTWTLLFIIPGIIAGYRYQLLPYLIMSESEEEKGVKKSHDDTKALVKGRLWELFGISFVAGIIPIIGSILGLSAKAAAYNQLNATSQTTELRPKIHWLNYLGALLIGAFLLFILLIIGILTIVILAKS